MNYMPKIKEQTLENETSALKKLLKDLRKESIQLTYSDRLELMLYMSDYLQQEKVSCSFISLVIRCLEYIVDQNLSQLNNAIPDIVKEIRVSLMRILHKDICIKCKFIIVRFLVVYRQVHLLTKKNVQYINELNKELAEKIDCEHFQRYLNSWDIQKNNTFNIWMLRMIPSIIFILLSLYTSFKFLSLFGFIAVFLFICIKYPVIYPDVVTSQDCLDSCCNQCSVTLPKKKKQLSNVPHKVYIDESDETISEEYIRNLLKKSNKEDLSPIEESNLETPQENEPMDKTEQEMMQKVYEQAFNAANTPRNKNLSTNSNNPPIILPDTLGQDLYDLRDKLKNHNPVNTKLLKQVEEGIEMFEQIKKANNL